MKVAVTGANVPGVKGGIVTTFEALTTVKDCNPGCERASAPSVAQCAGNKEARIE